MRSSEHDGRKSDASGWLVIGGIGSLSMLGAFLAYLAGEIRNSGPSGASALAALGFLACAVFAAVALGPIGRAIGKRILQGGSGPAASDAELQDLRLQVEDLRNALVEARERIDFTERMIAGGKERALEELH
jgi:hypothetical protein